MNCWASRHKVRLHFIQPGKPMQNGFVESLNGTLHPECLSANRFRDLQDARITLLGWSREHNDERPHSRIGRIPAAVRRLTGPLRVTSYTTAPSTLDSLAGGASLAACQSLDTDGKA